MTHGMAGGGLKDQAETVGIGKIGDVGSIDLYFEASLSKTAYLAHGGGDGLVKARRKCGGRNDKCVLLLSRNVKENGVLHDLLLVGVQTEGKDRHTVVLGHRKRDLPCREGAVARPGNGHFSLTNNEITIQRIKTGQLPIDPQILAVMNIGEAGTKQRNSDLISRLNCRHGREITAEIILRMKILQGHTVQIVAEILVAIVDSVVSVKLIDNVMELGEHKSAQLIMPSELVHHVFVLPGNITFTRIALDAPYVSAFAVHTRDVGHSVALIIILLRALKGTVAEFINHTLYPLVTVGVEMPGIDIGHRMVPAAGGVILHKASGVQRLCPVPTLNDPFCRLGSVLLVLGSVLFFREMEKAPCFVENDPIEYRRIVAVANDLFFHFGLKLFLGLGNGFTPEARNVLHDQKSQLVGIVKLERLLGLDVDTRHVDADALKTQDLITAVIVGGQREEALRVKALVKNTVDIIGLAVKRNIIPVVGAKFSCADLADTEICAYRIVTKGQRTLIEIGLLGRPQTGILDGKLNIRLARLDLGRSLDITKVGRHGHTVGSTRAIDLVGDCATKLCLNKEVINKCLGTCLKPNRLPDTARIAVSLLAVGLSLFAEVSGIHLDDIVTVAVKAIGNIKFKTVVAALVSAHHRTVDTHLAGIVHGAEHQPDPCTCRIPAYRFAIISRSVRLLANSRQRRAPGVRDLNGPVIFLFLQRKGPRAVEIQPLISLLVGLGKLCFLNCHFLFPFTLYSNHVRTWDTWDSQNHGPCRRWDISAEEAPSSTHSSSRRHKIQAFCRMRRCTSPPQALPQSDWGDRRGSSPSFPAEGTPWQETSFLRRNGDKSFLSC